MRQFANISACHWPETRGEARVGLPVKVAQRVNRQISHRPHLTPHSHVDYQPVDQQHVDHQPVDRVASVSPRHGSGGETPSGSGGTTGESYTVQVCRWGIFLSSFWWWDLQSMLMTKPLLVVIYIYILYIYIDDEIYIDYETSINYEISIDNLLILRSLNKIQDWI